MSNKRRVVAAVVVTPVLAAEDIPEWIIDNHREAILAGTMYRLHNEIQKPYSDVGKARYYGQLSRWHIAQAKTIADKNYGQAEHEWHFPRYSR